MSPRSACCLLAFAAAFAAATPAGASDTRPFAAGVRLSNETTSTRWAHPSRVAAIRRSPSPLAAPIVATRLRTEDGFAEVYVVLRSRRDAAGHNWLQVRIPMRPNGSIGWVRRQTLGPLYRVRTQLVIERGRQLAILFRRGRPIWRAHVGVGKPGTPTPAGNFWIREKFRTGDPGGPYGPVAFGSSDYSVLSDWPGGGVVGIHGTDQPSLIPGRPSHGCIRVANHAVRRLWHLLPIGTPLLIRERAPYRVGLRPNRPRAEALAGRLALAPQ